MSYRILDLELSVPLPELQLRADENGLAVVGRWHGLFRSFRLFEAFDGATIDAAGLRRWAAALARSVEEPSHEPFAVTEASIAVAIPTHNRADRLRRCVESLRAAEQVHGRARSTGQPLEIVVVDNAPNDTSTRLACERMPGVRYVLEPRQGISTARNRGLVEASADWVAFLDDDVVVDRHWLARLDKTIDRNPSATAITGAVLPLALETDAQVALEKRGGFLRVEHTVWFSPSGRFPPVEGQKPRFYPLELGFGAGCNMAFRRDVAVRLGGFDDALAGRPPYLGGEDLDLLYRVLCDGGPIVYEPSVAVFHEHRRTKAALRRMYWSWGTAYLAFLGKTATANGERRGAIRGVTARWFRKRLRDVAAGAFGRRPGGVDLALAEIAGGAFSLATRSYQRSRRRTAAEAGRSVAGSPGGKRLGEGASYR